MALTPVIVTSWAMVDQGLDHAIKWRIHCFLKRLW
jgi:hypothetical protein